MKIHKIRAGVVGLGLIGQRRARVIAGHSRSELAWVADANPDLAQKTAREFGVPGYIDWESALQSNRSNAVVVSTPNFLLAPIAAAALKSGNHVLIEKPMGKNLADALVMSRAAVKSRQKLKIGFNHRYHPGIAKAYALFKKGAIGRALNLRCQYGHGGRKGYEKEWRGNVKMSGGGELTDQGVHVIDLIQWFCGTPKKVCGFLQTAFWPIRPSEDNGFAMLQYADGAVASFHTSWTQWKNLFNFEIFGTKGSLKVTGLGGSYGTETLTVTLRKKEGGVPDQSEESFAGPDLSWKLEWDDFSGAVLSGRKYLGGAPEGLGVMRTLDALYRSHRSGKVVAL